MTTPWVASSNRLPHDGDAVEFVLDGRSIPIDGTYAQQLFKSRWSGYDVQRVRTWRRCDADRAPAATAADALAYCD